MYTFIKIIELTLPNNCLNGMDALKTDKLPILLTDDAIAEIKELYIKGKYTKEYGLRLGVKGGGCSGFTYILDFDKSKDNDSIYYLDNIPVYIDKSQSIYLYDCEIDFKSGLDNRGFIFKNPNAISTCGCGTSFSA
jgi:iron-sulfur cluster assembly protein